MILTKAGHEVLGVAHDDLRALDLLHGSDCDIVLLDISLGTNMTGIDIARIIRDKYEMAILFITSFSDKTTLDEAKQVYPDGYIVKPFKKKDILANIEIALARRAQKPTSRYLSREELNAIVRQPVSNKEYELLLDISEGATNQEICDKHYISMNTVKTHMKRIFAKLDVHNRSQAGALVLRR